MAVRVFALLGATVLQVLQRKITQAVCTWCTDWGVDHDAVSVVCSRAWEAPLFEATCQWQHYRAEIEKSLWIHWPENFLTRLQDALFPPDSLAGDRVHTRDSIAAEVAGRAAAALVDRIVHGLLIQDSARMSAQNSLPDESIFGMASGAVLAKIQVGTTTISCFFNHAVVAAIDTRFSQKNDTTLHGISLNALLRQIPIALPVPIGQVDVDLGSLTALAVGDAVCLKTSIDRPLAILGPDATTLFCAYLGRLDKSLAIEATGSA